MSKFLSLLLIVALASCAQKERGKHKVTEKNKAPLTINQESKGATEPRVAMVSWETGGKRFRVERKVEGTGVISLINPVTISKEIPNSLEISIQGDFSAKDIESLAIKAKISSSKDSAGSTPAVILSADLKGDVILVTGLRAFFQSQGESKGILRIDYFEKTSKVSIGTLFMEIRSLNSNIEISRATPEGSTYRQLNSSTARYDLLEVIHFKNNGEEKVELKYQSKLTGYLARDFHQFGYRQLKCKCETWEKSWQEQYPTDFRLLPIGEELQLDWTKVLLQEAFTMLLEPGQEIALGLYGMGESLKSFIDQGVRTSSHEQKEVVVGCETVDPNESKRPNSYTPVYGFVPYGLDVAGVLLYLNQGGVDFDLRNGDLDERDDPASFSLHYSILDFRLF